MSPASMAGSVLDAWCSAAQSALGYGVRASEMTASVAAAQLAMVRMVGDTVNASLGTIAPVATAATAATVAATTAAIADAPRIAVPDVGVVPAPSGQYP